MGREFQKAEVEGVEFKTEDKKEIIDEVVEATKQMTYQMVDMELTAEIVNTLRGHYTPDLIYNKPVYSPTGAIHHKACDRMKGGKCPYAGQPHEHIVGVGIKGAEEAFRAYGKLRISVPDMPDIVEKGDKLYWAVRVVGQDLHNDNQTEKWYLETVLLKTKKGYMEKEHGALICQSKAQRNVILALIPNAVMRHWIEDYLNGNDEPFQKYEPDKKPKVPAKAKSEDKPSEPKPEKKPDPELAAMLSSLSQQLGVDIELMKEYVKAKGWTVGNTKLTFARALSGPEELETFRIELMAFIDAKLAEEAEQAKQQEEAEPVLEGMPAVE